MYVATHRPSRTGCEAVLSRGNPRSYQWDVQPAVLRIAASMRARRFKVWVDTEMMSGSTLDSMAAAVEDAYCVLICITGRYKVLPPPLPLRVESNASPPLSVNI